jgi:hypothetical protein
MIRRVQPTTESAPTPPEMLAAALETDIASLDYRPERTGCVVSLTSVPSRLGYLKAVLVHLLRQTAGPVPIELHLPQQVESTGERWGALPDWLTGLEAVRVVWYERDIGPTLKYLGAMTDHRDSDPLVVAVDDDVLYPPSLVDVLLEAERAGDGPALYCTRGFSIHPSLRWEESMLLPVPPPGEPARVAVATGHGGHAVRPSTVDVDALWNTEGVPLDAHFNDDMWLSGNLSRWGIPKLLVHAPPRHRLKVESAFGYDRARRMDAGIAYFRDAWRPEEYWID